MRHDNSPRPDFATVADSRRDWRNLRTLMVYLWEYRGRVLFALGCLVFAKIATVGVPLVLKEIVDALDASRMPEVVLPVALLAAYGALRLAATLFNELRDVLFARVRYHAIRRLTLRTVEHLHALSLRFHLERRTGAISRDLQRAAGSLSTLLNYMVFSILPVLVELGLVIGILVTRYKPVFTVVVLVSMAVYTVFTVLVSNWRIEHRHEMNRLESQANSEALDGLLNYETVKYFTNEGFEAGRCDRTLAAWEDSAVLSMSSQSLLNFGQGAIIALGVTAILFFAAAEVAVGTMTLGDLVLVNAMLLQLFIPLGFLGIVYRQIRYALVDMDLLVRLIEEAPEITDRPGAGEMAVTRGEVRFEQVSFAYQPERPILKDVSFTIPPGGKMAVVGPSGAGKSTLVRLLYRFYDVSAGRIVIDGRDIRDVRQASLRRAIGIVPQDTVLFNESIRYNLAYARIDATPAEIEAAAKVARIHDFIMGLPNGYDTIVGERGLKLSGGEKQRVAIARAVLKNPRILVFDEATSALDSEVEGEILRALREVAQNHTTLAIAHRLSTVVDADSILVMEDGRIVESGRHQDLLALGGLYARLWEMQQSVRNEGGDAPRPPAVPIQDA